MPNPCLFGGNCAAIDEIEYSCTCPNGFTGKLNYLNLKITILKNNKISGKDCETAPPCTPTTCEETGVCKFDVFLGKNICLCKPGYVAGKKDKLYSIFITHINDLIENENLHFS